MVHSQLCHWYKNKPRIVGLGGGVRSVSVPSLLAVRWPTPFSKYTIWVMVGIQGRVVAIDFSASAAHGSKLGPDGRSVSFSPVFQLQGMKAQPCLFVVLCRVLSTCVLSFQLLPEFTTSSLLRGTISADKALR